MASEAPRSWIEKLVSFARFLRDAAPEISRYLIYLRVPLILLAVAVVAFATEQVSDVLLAMALEPEWGAFWIAALAAAVFGTALWFSARTLSERRWMRGLRAEETMDQAHRDDATPNVVSMPKAMVWWVPRILGMTPALLMAVVFLWRVGEIGMGRRMALVLILEAAVLLGLFYARTRLTAWLARVLPRVSRTPLAQSLLRIINRTLTVKSGSRLGLFSPGTELALMALAWTLLALIAVPIARAAYGPLAGGSLHLYVVLLAGAGVLALERVTDLDALMGTVKAREKSKSRQYWTSFALLLLLSLLLPLLITASGLSGVAIPRALGSIAILYSSLSIFTIFATNFFLFGTNTGIPLLSLLLVAALVLASFRVNDNHAVRLLPGRGSATLPSLQESFEAWLQRDGRLRAIQASDSRHKWPIYLVSAQGGGVYAAYHSAKALGLLSEEVPTFPDHLFALSGVSGGSVGTTLYVNALNQATPAEPLVQRLDQTFEQDQLSTVLAALLFPDATQRFYPFPVPAWDRALGLELSFSDGGRRTPAPVSLEGSFYGDQKGPFLVLNTTEVQSGRRLLLSPFQFGSDSTFHVPDRQDVRFSTAAVMSARFPLITPYAFFDGSEEQRQRRTVDGGYYDNSGAVTAEELVRALNGEIRRLHLETKAEVIPMAIVGIDNVRAHVDTDNRTSVVDKRGSGPLRSFSAIDALFNAREARVGKALGDYGLRCGHKGDNSLCITLQTKYQLLDQANGANEAHDIPLGWTLSCQARAFISDQLAVERTVPPPCLTHQGTSTVLKPSGPVAGKVPGVPSFAQIVQRVREQVGQSGA
jgi:hypothetical protein